MYWLAKAAVTKYHRLDGLNNSYFFTVWELRWLGQVVSGGQSLSLAFRWPVLSLSLPAAPLCVLVFSCENTSQFGLEAHPEGSLWLSYLFEDHVSQHSHVLRNSGLELQHKRLGMEVGTRFSAQ